MGRFLHEASEDRKGREEKTMLLLEKPLNPASLVIKPFKCSAVRSQEIRKLLSTFFLAVLVVGA